MFGFPGGKDGELVKVLRLGSLEVLADAMADLLRLLLLLQIAKDCANASAFSVEVRLPIRPFLSLSLGAAHMQSIRNCLH